MSYIGGYGLCSICGWNSFNCRCILGGLPHYPTIPFPQAIPKTELKINCDCGDLKLRINSLEEEIKKLQQSREANSKTNKDYAEELKLINSQLKAISDWMLDKQEMLRLHDESIDSLEVANTAKLNKPYKCPVCEGKVLYGSCKSCNKGIVWG